MLRLPRVLMTCGDPYGIGPEVCLGAWNTPQVHREASLRIVADPSVLQNAIDSLSFSRGMRIEVTSAFDTRASGAKTVLVIPPNPPSTTRPVHELLHDCVENSSASTALGGHAAASAVETAIALVLAKKADAIVTGPLNKVSLHAAGYDFPGHTEMLARACQLADRDVSMMLYLPKGPPLEGPHGLGVVHTTLHESLRSALDQISTTRIVEAGLRLVDMLAHLGTNPPRIAVAALNPHAGEGGLFGNEEQEIIAPAVEELCKKGCFAVGPIAADTLFLKARDGAFDGIVAHYHDQGHIAMKLLGMHRAVNVTLGIPLLRTSAAHGTAFDIAGTGTADPSSMINAVLTAVRLFRSGWPT